MRDEKESEWKRHWERIRNPKMEKLWMSIKKTEKSEEKCRLIKQERRKENLLLVCTESSMSSDKKLYQSREFGHFEFKQVWYVMCNERVELYIMIIKRKKGDIFEVSLLLDALHQANSHKDLDCVIKRWSLLFYLLANERGRLLMIIDTHLHTDDPKHLCMYIYVWVCIYPLSILNN